MTSGLNRRQLLKRIGAATLGVVTPKLLKGERLKEPFKVTEKAISADILVVGGGTAGVIAAIQAGRTGRKVILVENGSQLGGTITTGGVSFPGLHFAWGKQIIGGISWELIQEAVTLNGDVLPNFSIPHGRQHWRHQVQLNGPLYAILAEQKCVEAGVDLRYYETPLRVEQDNGNWKVQTIGKGVKTEIIANQLIDCTGNAYVAHLAGFDLLQEEETQPGTLMFRLGGYDFDALDLELIKKRYEEAIEKKQLVRAEFRGDIVGLLRTKGDNIQHIIGADSSTSQSHTLANIYGRTSLFQHLKFIRTLPGCKNTVLEDMRTETAVRETYRIVGEYQVSHNDYVTGVVFDDAVSYSYYPIDLHVIDHGVTPRHLIEGVVPTIPLRALIPKNSRNFLVAGRCISSDRLANSALRVQSSCMAMGQAVGAAAALACVSKKSPLEVPISEVRQLIEEHGGIIPRV